MTDDHLYQLYLDGKATPNVYLFRAVGSDPVRYGNLVARIAAHKREQEEKKGKSVQERFEEELKARNYDFSKPPAADEEAPVEKKVVKTWCWCCRRAKKSE